MPSHHWDLYMARLPKMQSAIRSRPVTTAIHLTPQSALPNPRTCVKRSKLEPRGPRTASNLAPEAPE
eukprot:15460884-Alexandrium_andersonii.AAC.1